MATKLTLGSLTDLLFSLREQKRDLEAKVKVIELDYAAAETELMALLDAQGTSTARGAKASCSVTSSIVGDPTDWDALNKYIAKKKYFHLYQRRLSDPALRELWEQGVTIPGVEQFTRKRLNVRTL